MKLDKLSPTELAQFAINFLALLAGTELSAIESHVRAILIAAIGTLPDEVMTQDADAEASQLATNAKFALRNESTGKLLKALRQGRDSLSAGDAPGSQFELAGFGARDTSRSTYVAQIPSDLAVDGFSNGANIGRFKGNNKSGSVTYEIYRREGDTGDWALCAAGKETKFTDAPVTPGQYYEYKVRAKASKNVSLFSNSAVVYGGSKSGAGGGA